MKHQYFGDVNDYRKYGLLRTLQAKSGLRLGVWWMMTPDDGRPDGRLIHYLTEPDRWRQLDPGLYDSLARVVVTRRSVDAVSEHRILGDASFEEAIVPDSRSSRAASFAAAKERLRSAELIFVDPDNGLEIGSCPPGRKGSSKYVLRAELKNLFAGGHSILVYQHFRREERVAFIKNMAMTLRSLTGACSATCFQTSHVAFFLLPQEHHDIPLRAATDQVRAIWGDEIRPWCDTDV